jgi:hypothetical protein
MCVLCMFLTYMIYAPSCIALDQGGLRTSPSWDHLLRLSAPGGSGQSGPVSSVQQPIMYLHSCHATIFSIYNRARYYPVCHLTRLFTLAVILLFLLVLLNLALVVSDSVPSECWSAFLALWSRLMRGHHA